MKRLKDARSIGVIENKSFVEVPFPVWLALTPPTNDWTSGTLGV